MFNSLTYLSMKVRVLVFVSQFSSVQLLSWLDSLWCQGLQHARPPCPSPTPRASSDLSPLSLLCHPTISSSVAPFSSCLQSFPESGSFPMSQFLASGDQSIGISVSANQSFQWIFRSDFLEDGLAGSPCSPRDSQGSSPTPQFKSISSSTLSFLYSPNLTSIHNYWKNRSFDWMDIC